MAGGGDQILLSFSGFEEGYVSSCNNPTHLSTPETTLSHMVLKGQELCALWCDKEISVSVSFINMPCIADTAKSVAALQTSSLIIK